LISWSFLIRQYPSSVLSALTFKNSTWFSHCVGVLFMDFYLVQH
jgi:hypothetical protein